MLRNVIVARIQSSLDADHPNLLIPITQGLCRLPKGRIQATRHSHFVSLAALVCFSVSIKLYRIFPRLSNNHLLPQVSRSRHHLRGCGGTAGYAFSTATGPGLTGFVLALSAQVFGIRRDPAARQQGFQGFSKRESIRRPAG